MGQIEESNELRNQNSILSEENKNLKAQIEELESENKRLNEKMKSLNSQASEGNAAKTGTYSGEWFTDGLNVNDVSQKFYPSHIIVKAKNDSSYEIIGYSGINSFVVSATVDGESIKVHDDFTWTNIPGDAEIMDFENAFLKCLKGASEIQLLRGGEGRYLTITNADENSNLWFRYGEPSSFLPDVENP
ncbi:MAG: META domain-containing protein [Treponema sp.]|nr:META domain-containing protein [Treponema sp.]